MSYSGSSLRNRIVTGILAGVAAAVLSATCPGIVKAHQPLLYGACFGYVPIPAKADVNAPVPPRTPPQVDFRLQVWEVGVGVPRQLGIWLDDPVLDDIACSPSLTGATRSWEEYERTLDRLKTRYPIKLISRPRIIAVSGQEVFVLLPMRTTEETRGPDGNLLLETADSEATMRIEPMVWPDGRVLMEICEEYPRPCFPKSGVLIGRGRWPLWLTAGPSQVSVIARLPVRIDGSVGIPIFWELPSDVSVFKGIQSAKKRLLLVVIEHHIVDPYRDLLGLLRLIEHHCHGGNQCI